MLNLCFISFYLQINYNGHITFSGPYNDHSPKPLNETGRNIFGVYFSDNALYRPNGLLHYRITQDTTDLAKAKSWIDEQLSPDSNSFIIQYCIVATWENVKYYVRNASHENRPDTQQENTYQLILCTNGVEGHVIYQYYKLEWAKSQDKDTNYATVRLDL